MTTKPNRDRSESAQRRAGNLLAAIDSNSAQILDVLSCVETRSTAVAELGWIRRALTNVGDLVMATEKRIPVGDVAVYMPFNVPLYTFYLYVVAPVLAGNRVSVHLSSATGWVLETILERLGDCMEGEVRCPALSRAEFTSKVALRANAILIAGDWSTGQHFLERADPDVALLYQGAGISSLVVTADANLDQAAAAACRAKLFNSGQDCCSIECIYVHRDVAGEFVRKLVERVQRVRVGDDFDIDVQVGRLTRPDDARALLERYRSAPDLEVLHPAYVDGGYMHPGVYRMDRKSPLFRIEKFCPLFALAEFDSTDELTRELLVADNRMIASIFGSPGPLRRLEAAYGHTLYNTTIYDVEEPHRPFGGYGRSTFTRAPKRPLRDGPMYVPVETTMVRGL